MDPPDHAGGHFEHEHGERLRQVHAGLRDRDAAYVEAGREQRFQHTSLDDVAVPQLRRRRDKIVTAAIDRAVFQDPYPA